MEGVRSVADARPASRTQAYVGLGTRPTVDKGESNARLDPRTQWEPDLLLLDLQGRPAAHASLC